MVDYSIWTNHELLSKIAVELDLLKIEVDKFLRPRLSFYIGNERQRRIYMLDTEKAVASIELDDAKGFPTGGAFDQPPAWSQRLHRLLME